jgi:hypothetical protein
MQSSNQRMLRDTIGSSQRSGISAMASTRSQSRMPQLLPREISAEAIMKPGDQTKSAIGSVSRTGVRLQTAGP